MCMRIKLDSCCDQCYAGTSGLKNDVAEVIADKDVMGNLHLV